MSGNKFGGSLIIEGRPYLEFYLLVYQVCYVVVSGRDYSYTFGESFSHDLDLYTCKKYRRS